MAFANKFAVIPSGISKEELQRLRGEGYNFIDESKHDDFINSCKQNGQKPEILMYNKPKPQPKAENKPKAKKVYKKGE